MGRRAAAGERPQRLAQLGAPVIKILTRRRKNSVARKGF
jgi:hypothetical protein